MQIGIEVIREVVRRYQHSEAPEYSPETGVTCPVCRKKLPSGKCGILVTKSLSPNSRIRHHACPRCGSRFKSVQLVGL